MEEQGSKKIPIPHKIIERAKILFLRGHSARSISLKLGISESSISRYRSSGEWDDEILPNFNLSDLLDDSREILFEYFQCVLSGDEDDFSRAAINLQKLVRCVGDLEEIREKVGIRDEILVSENMMKWMVENDKHDHLEAVQEYHDLKLSEL